MKIKDLEEVYEVVDFLKEKDVQIKRMGKVESLSISSNMESAIIEAKTGLDGLLFSKIKNIVMIQLKKDRQSALRRLIKLGVEV